MRVCILRPGDEILLAEAVELADEGPLTPERATDHLSDPALVAVVAIDEGAIVGFIYGFVLLRFECRSMFIYSVDVVESHHRRGIGKAIIAALKTEGRGRWDEMFVMTNCSNAAAMALYRSSGGIRTFDDEAMFDFAG